MTSVSNTMQRCPDGYVNVEIFPGKFKLCLINELYPEGVDCHRNRSFPGRKFEKIHTVVQKIEQENYEKSQEVSKYMAVAGVIYMIIAVVVMVKLTEKFPFARNHPWLVGAIISSPALAMSIVYRLYLDNESYESDKKILAAIRETDRLCNASKAIPI